jgi:hypothetical protein
MKITPKRICYYTAESWKWQVYLKVLDKTLAGEAKINELMKEFAADNDLKPHIKDIAGMVPRAIKALTKMPNERKANLIKIKPIDEKEILDSANGFLKERFKAEICVFSEEYRERYDPKNRAVIAVPYQPAIYVE